MRHIRTLLLAAAVVAVVLPAAADAQPRGRAVPRGPGRVYRPPVIRSAPPVVRIAPSYRFYGPYSPALGFYYGYPWAYGPTTWGPYGYGYGRWAYGAAPAFGAQWYGSAAYPYGYSGYYGGYGYAPPATGGLRLAMPHLDAEVYVDGYYAGIVDDFDGPLQQLNLEPGPHRIEVRAPGFEAVTFEVNTQLGRTVTYRAALRPLEP